MALSEVAKKWVERLRSGEVKKTTGQLGRSTGSRCCLGVLCDLAVEAGIIKGYEIARPGLPKEVANWANLVSFNGSYTSSHDNERTLAADNDRSKSSFNTIADIIESEPKGLFRETK